MTGPGAPPPVPVPLPTVRVLGRGIARRCAHCGSGGLFEGWLTLRSACPRCGLRFQRQEGFMLGSMTINMIVTFVSLALVVGGAMIGTWPDVPIGLVIGSGAAVAIVVPVVFYPFAATIWVAVEWLMRPADPDEFTESSHP